MDLKSSMPKHELGSLPTMAIGSYGGRLWSRILDIFSLAPMVHKYLLEFD